MSDLSLFPGTVIGAVIMEGYYVVFDRQNKQMGFAQTTCPQRQSSYVSKVTGPHNTTGTLITFYTYFCQNIPTMLWCKATLKGGLQIGLLCKRCHVKENQ